MFTRYSPLSLSISIHAALMSIKPLSKRYNRTPDILLSTLRTRNEVNHSPRITVKSKINIELSTAFVKLTTLFNIFTSLTSWFIYIYIYIYIPVYIQNSHLIKLTATASVAQSLGRWQRSGVAGPLPSQRSFWHSNLPYFKKIHILTTIVNDLWIWSEYDLCFIFQFTSSRRTWILLLYGQENLCRLTGISVASVST